MSVSRLLSSRAVAVATLAVVLVVASLASQSGAATDKDVRVINTPAEAVPVAPQGTTQVAGTVNVGNFPSNQGIPPSEILVDQASAVNWPTETQAGVNDLDVTHYRTVRVSIAVFGGCPVGPCKYNMSVIGRIGDTPYHLEDVTDIPFGEDFTATYEIPGETIDIHVSTANIQNGEVLIGVLGRQN